MRLHRAAVCIIQRSAPLPKSSAMYTIKNVSIPHFFRTHHRKIIIGAPIIFLLLIGSGKVIGGGNELYPTAAKRFYQIGDEVVIRVVVDTRVPVNAIGGALVYPERFLGLDSISRSDSIVDLWAEEPLRTAGAIAWGGGILGEKSEMPLKGAVFAASFVAREAGKAVLTVRNGQLLAADGEGTNIISAERSFAVYITAKGAASPDINGDGELSIADANSLYLRTFRSYDARYDLNGDGKVSWDDVRALLAFY